MDNGDRTERSYPLGRLARGVSGDEILDTFLEYVADKGLELYEAQEQAILELIDGANVILKTPTGSGKSLVAAAMHFKALCQGRRSVYTCPIKALVNEKFLALCRDFGPDNVGMSTGDATVNADAPILCCTAEVLSNMALRSGERLAVDDVIMDEFHYYSDRERGGSWQIPLLTLPQCRFLLLSATMGATGFFEEQIEGLTGERCVTVTGTERPVPLEFEYTELPLDEVLLRMQEKERLPAYLVHFTQRATVETAQNLTSLNFCSKSEKAAIAEVIAEVPFNSPFGRELKKFLRHGIGIHHAGMLPKYRILVEKLAQENRLKVICGTDTLGVGVNVPIRTVIFTGLSKYDGERVRILPVRDFHQISGRAGRKGFDDQGYVTVQAPEHIIENRKIEKKAKENPKKAKKLVKKKPPEKGYVGWDEKTFQSLVDSEPESLTSSFQVNHGILLNVLSREGDGCTAMRLMIRNCHENDARKRALRRRGWQLFRALLDKEILELLPEPDEYGRKVRVHTDLQVDFSLNQALSLYLVDTVDNLDPEDPEYPYKILALVESVLEDPGNVLRKQVDKLKTELLRELKAQGVEYDERMERLQEVEHPKPYRDFIYDTFNTFADQHPWVGEDNIQPKSIALEMFERYMSFADYVREYGLQRVEGLLLRHLSNVYKTLTQTVPDSYWSEEVEEIIFYLQHLVRSTDSSILDEWETLKNPDYQRPEEPEPEAPPKVRVMDPKRDQKELERLVRDGIFRFLRPLSGRNYKAAAQVLAGLAGRPESDAEPPPVVKTPELEINEGRGTFPWHSEALENAAAEILEEDDTIRLDPTARARENTRTEEDPITNEWLVEQLLVNRDDEIDRVLRFKLDLPAIQETGECRLELYEMSKMGG